jgi:hypothetical protein
MSGRGFFGIPPKGALDDLTAGGDTDKDGAARRLPGGVPAFGIDHDDVAIRFFDFQSVATG